MRNYDKITRYDEYIIACLKEDYSFRVAGYELPNGRFVLCEANRAKVYVDYQSYRRKLGDLLENYRLNDSYADPKFISGTTKLITEEK